MKDLLVIFGGLLALVALLLVLLFFDARAFADECIRAGGYVAKNEVCIRP